MFKRNLIILNDFSKVICAIKFKYECHPSHYRSLLSCVPTDEYFQIQLDETNNLETIIECAAFRTREACGRHPECAWEVQLFNFD